MPLTRSFDETLRDRARRDSAFRHAMLEEAVGLLLENDFGTGKLMLRDFVNATIGFTELGRLTGKSPKSLMRMLSVDGNPNSGNLFAILRILQNREGIEFRIGSVDAA